MYRCYRLAALGIGVCMMCGCTPSSPKLAPVAPYEETRPTEAANIDVKDETELLPTRIQEVHWKLIGVEGKAVIALTGEREAYLILKLENLSENYQSQDKEWPQLTIIAFLGSGLK